MDVLPCAIVGARLMVDAIRQVLADPSFETTSSEASEARHTAERLSVWVENESNHGTFERFSTAVAYLQTKQFTIGLLFLPTERRCGETFFCFDLLRYSLCDGRSSLKQPKHRLSLFFPTCN